jgi:Tfp pilus assembly PilM family ATPase
MATVIEFTRTSVRLLQAEGAGRSLRIRKLAVAAITEPAQAAEALGRVVKEAKAEGSSVIVTVPREQIITRLLKFPTTRAEELAQATAENTIRLFGLLRAPPAEPPPSSLALAGGGQPRG